MEASQDHWITSVIFEHSCKENYEEVKKCILEDADLPTMIVQNSVNSSKLVDTTSETIEKASVEKPKIKPVFMLIYILKQMHSLENFTFKSQKDLGVLSVLLDLLETTYKQFNFMSLKRYFTLTSELKLLDLMNWIVGDFDSSHVVQKLNQHFPRWSPSYRAALEKDFNIESCKVLDTVEKSHTQCRRLILKLAVDKSHKAKYMSEQYNTDLSRLTRESKAYLLEAVSALESHAGSSVLEKIQCGEGIESSISDDVGVQLFMDYIHDDITADSLLKYLDDFEPVRNSQPASALTSCLLPFDTMSELSEESEQSDSEYEST